MNDGTKNDNARVQSEAHANCAAKGELQRMELKATLADNLTDFVQPMSKRGNSGDDSPLESFFARVKTDIYTQL